MMRCSFRAAHIARPPVHASGQTKTAIRTSEARLRGALLFEQTFAARTSNRVTRSIQATVGAPASVGIPTTNNNGRDFLMLA
jgi:hypothetical protein